MRIPKKPIEKEFVIDLPEFGDPATITIRQATTGDNMKRDELVSKTTLVQGEFGNELVQDVNVGEVFMREVFLTLSSAAGLDDDEDGTPIFLFEDGRVKDRAKFERAYKALPQQIVIAIHDKVLEVNPQWGNRAKQGESPAT